MLAGQLSAQGYLCVVGGGSENYNNWSDLPYRWMVEKAGRGPALVLHYDSGSAWLENYFKSFGAESAASLVIANRAAADDSANYAKIRSAKLLFLRGGDQSRYHVVWKGTLTERAITEVYQGGGVVGGTSAGLAVMGGVDYSALTPRSVVSSFALLNPFHPDITLTNDFLPLLPQVLFDSHFTARGRIGRLLAFVGQWNVSQDADLLGIGVDERTAFCIDPDGEGTVFGAGAVFVLHANPESELSCSANKPLFFTEWTLHALTQGFRYQVQTRQVSGIPASAQITSPAAPPAIDDRATLLLHGGTLPSQARQSLQEMIAASGNGPLLIIGGETGADFHAYLTNSLGAQNLELLTLSAENIFSGESAHKIRSAACAIVAGFSTGQCNALLAPVSEVQKALIDRCHSREATLLFSGPSISLLGSVYLKNPDAAGDDLQNGRLQASAGLAVLPSHSLMHRGFYYDDYIENRVGGLFWLLFRNPHGLGLHLDDHCQIKVAENKLFVQSDQPLILIDTQKVSVYDSSGYRYRTYNPPRQTAAFTGARLYCLPADDEACFDLEKRTWNQTSAVHPQRRSGAEKPEHFRLRIYPNPAVDGVHLVSPGAGADPVSEIMICNLRGQTLARIGDPFRNTPHHVWDGRLAQGGRASSGVYVLLYKTGEHYYREKFVLLR